MFYPKSIREGFANNSSSTHSIITVSPHEKIEDDFNSMDFGWDWFVLASKYAKAQYVAALLNANCGSPVDIKAAILKAVLPDQPYEYLKHVAKKAYMDHQSTLPLVVDANTKLPNIEFLREIVSTIMRDDVVVLGGNDNEYATPDEAAKILNGSEKLLTNLRRDTEAHFGRFDDKYGFWTILNPSDGTKVRFWLGEDKGPITKASTPELVDVKITDFCPYGCTMCYQGSTKEGKHANLYGIATALGELGVFECAIGGGEPTLHPEFWDFCEDLKRAGVIANFTTRNLSWLARPSLLAKFRENCKSFAYSADDKNSTKQACEDALASGILDEWKKFTFSIQYIMGIGNLKEVYEAIEASNNKGLIRLTILGWKDTERGVGGPDKKLLAKDEKAFKDILKGSGNSKIAIDTVMARSNETLLKEEGVSKWRYETKEGAFSCYIDAVEGYVYKSSYELDKHFKYVDANKLKKDFAEF